MPALASIHPFASEYPVNLGEREYTLNRIDKAGSSFRKAPSSTDSSDEDHYKVREWRSDHTYPLDKIQRIIQEKAAELGIDCTTVGRLKRFEAIKAKLVRCETRTMKLSQMDDIGGCRIVVENVDQTRDLSSSIQNEFGGFTWLRAYDYIEKPRLSGYRGIHEILKFSHPEDQWRHGYKIEVQLRTKLQHAWATAVEVFGTVCDVDLKAGSGSSEWIRFFLLASALIAIEERSALPPSAPDNESDLRCELANLSRECRILERHKEYHEKLTITNESLEPNSKNFLLKLQSKNQNLRVKGYSREKRQDAEFDYDQAEDAVASKRDGNTVLVSAESMQTLQAGYPNYFLDAGPLLEFLRSQLIL